MVDKSADSVLDEVESTIYQVAQQILSGEGFTYGIPSRSKGNQVYVPELDRIVLKDSKSQRPFASTSTCRKAVITTRILQLIHELCLKRIHVTKRDLFYTDVKLFEVGARCSRRYGSVYLGLSKPYTLYVAHDRTSFIHNWTAWDQCTVPLYCVHDVCYNCTSRQDPPQTMHKGSKRL